MRSVSMVVTFQVSVGSYRGYKGRFCLRRVLKIVCRPSGSFISRYMYSAAGAEWDAQPGMYLLDVLFAENDHWAAGDFPRPLISVDCVAVAGFFLPFFCWYISKGRGWDCAYC